MEGYGNDEFRVIEDHAAQKHLPLGNPISPKISLVLGDVLELWNFLCIVHGPLGLKNPLSLEELTSGLGGCLCDGLHKAHVSMLHILLDDRQRELEHGRKSNVGCSTADVSIINELTWPEIARRYALAFHSSCGLDLANARVGIDFFRCFHGDGGPLCGAFTGGAELKVDTLLLEAAVTKIYGSLNYNDDMLIIDDIDSETGSSGQNVMVNEGIPDWIQELVPVRELKANVGSKIKNCIQNSLQKCPPRWAIKELEDSISKEVYKANASGATKKAVRYVIARFCSMQQNIASSTDRRKSISLSDIVLKKCRVVLRQTAAVLCNLAREKITFYSYQHSSWKLNTEMVQAMIILEDMINPNYLDLSWRRWSSWSAAASITTLAALSLRVYSFDAAITYEKISSPSNPTKLDSGSDEEKKQPNLGSTRQRRKKQNNKNEGTS